MRGLAIFITLSYALTLSAQSSPSFGPLPDGVLFPIVTTNQFNSDTLHAGDRVKFKMSNNLRGPGGVVAIPKDADVLGNVVLLQTQPDGAIRLRLTLNRAEWPGGGMDLHAFITYIQSGEMTAAKGLHAQFSSDPDVGIDLISKTPIILGKDAVLTVRQTTRGDTLAKKSSDLVPPGKTISAALKSFIDVRKCKQGDALQFETLGELHSLAGELVIPAHADLLGKVVQCNPRHDNSQAIWSAIIDSAKWSKGSLPLRMAVEIPGANSLGAQSGRSFTAVIQVEKGKSPQVPGFYRGSTGTTDNPFDEVEFRPSSSPSQPGALVSPSRDFRFELGTVFVLRQLPAK